MGDSTRSNDKFLTLAGGAKKEHSYLYQDETSDVREHAHLPCARPLTYARANESAVLLLVQSFCPENSFLE
jgi:hypothetical protein